MSPRAARLAIAVTVSGGVSLALVGCDALFGIQTYPDETGESGAVDASVGTEASAEAAQEAPADVLDGSVEATVADTTTPRDATLADGPPDALIEAGPTECNPECAPAASRCVGNSLQSCNPVDGCFLWSTPVACATAQACWQANTAYCCAGGSDVCAPSCQGTIFDASPGIGCGPSGTESCCASLPVTGGTFDRSYDGVTDTDMTSPATVSDFTLDTYEVTVARFRQFVEGWANGWRPAAGSGIHTHLNGGKGLADSSHPGSFETGWNPSWTSTQLDTLTAWTQALDCGTFSTWSIDPAGRENLPINCVDWYMAYSFCIWDGGFLPSEAEWNYAAAGGGASDGQRVYAWSSPSTSETIDCTYAAYGSCAATSPVAAGLLFKGNGKYGQADLTGNVWEWNLDAFSAYVTPCHDCAYLTDTGQRTIRGESFSYPANNLYVATRGNDDPTDLYAYDGIRCARAP
jgi:sulfatase modifying factor 1